jgi:trehalose-phosphatase
VLRVTTEPPAPGVIASLPTARVADVVGALHGRRPAVFLDYDGTLTPIVERAEDARIDDGVRDVLSGLARQCTVGIVSGRDLADVRAMVAVDGIAYAGSHGFDVVAPDGTATQKGTDFLAALDSAEAVLRDCVRDILGARVERKRFAVAVHTRQVDDAATPAVSQIVRKTAESHPTLTTTRGKQVIELRPDLDWNKGSALLFLLDSVGADHPGVMPLYIGDDVTDEDAFAVVAARGLGLVVRGEDDARPTLATYALDDTDAVVELLAQLRDALEE